MPDGDNLVLGTTSTADNTTSLNRSGSIQRAALRAENGNGDAISGSCPSGTGRGVTGGSANGIGVFGGTARGGAGVFGHTFATTGVRGVSLDGVGVAGSSEASVGVLGEAEQRGLTDRPIVTTGVLGRSHPGNGRGVVGESRNGWAVLGSTTTGWAGVFHGRAIVFGGFFVWGGPKSAVVPHPDGSHRQLYTLESPESWFEDFGRGEVVNGRGRVELDPDFAAVVRSDDYHVFLSPEGNSNGLFVSERAPDGFEVREQRRGRSRLSFSYRVVARRRDVEVERLARAEELPAAVETPVSLPPVEPVEPLA
jgi:hypothetical protein